MATSVPSSKKPCQRDHALCQRIPFVFVSCLSNEFVAEHVLVLSDTAVSDGFDMDILAASIRVSASIVQLLA